MKPQRHLTLLFLAFLLAVWFTGPLNEAIAEEKGSDKTEKKRTRPIRFSECPRSEG